MPTSDVLECNKNFKYPKNLPAALNSSILAENGAGSTNNSYFIMPTGCVLHWNQYLESAKNCLRRQNKREKGKRKREGRKLFIKSAKVSRPSAKRERRASGWEKWHPVKKYLRQLCLPPRNPPHRGAFFGPTAAVVHRGARALLESGRNFFFRGFWECFYDFDRNEKYKMRFTFKNKTNHEWTDEFFRRLFAPKISKISISRNFLTKTTPKYHFF